MNLQANWIKTSIDIGNICPVFRRKWKQSKRVKEAELIITCLGVYEATINGKRIGNYVLAPGWTAYKKRLQYQIYSITSMLQDENEIRVTIGKGWFNSPMPGWEESEDKIQRKNQKNALIAEIHLTYEDGTTEIINTDEEWEWCESSVRFSEIYDGEVYDATFLPEKWSGAKITDWSKDILIEQEGEFILEQERIQARSVFTTPKGEVLVDFGQEITGYVEFKVNAKAGETVLIQHGEVLDTEGDFYNENYRSAKAEINYICSEGEQTYHPHLTFLGFRYIKLVKFPEEVKPENFTAIAVYSDIKKTGSLKCSDAKLNQLFSNIFWGQRGNFLDIPTDCPQRDERLGWTGDAQVFVKAASYNFDVERFFAKWLKDLSADQRENGAVGQVIPDYMPHNAPSAAWGDAAAICPWQIYMTYGNKSILGNQFQSMKKWVDYITNTTKDQFLWTGGEHFGDWLGLDAPAGSYKGSTREDFIATAYYAYSTSLVVKAGKVLQRDVELYEELYQNILKKFRESFPDYRTQTEYTLAIWFELTQDLQKAADQLAKMIKDCGSKLQTGFVGTPYLLHVLSKYGHEQLAYDLLLRQEYPSWLYAVNKGATTIWEHWDGIMEDGSFWSEDMNSFNHYAYGAVADWIYEEAAGIHTIETYPGFEKIIIEPKPDKRIQWLEASIDTRHGKILTRWDNEEDGIKYTISTPVQASIIINGVEQKVEPGHYNFRV